MNIIKGKIMTTTEAAAWWGAGVATLVLFWDIYKWAHAGPRLKLSASTDMVSQTPFGKGKDKYIFVTVANVGSSKTTISHLGLVYFRSCFRKWLRMKPTKLIIVLMPAFAKPIPYVIDAGENWSGGIVQDSAVDKWLRDGYLFCYIYQLGRSKPHQIRVRQKNLL
ncbi:MAG: hypothetical protein WAW37_18205 [Syntrophobacteraceae bacterium]